MRLLGLPFSFQVDGDVSSGGAASLQQRLAPPLDDEAFDQLRCVIAWWAEPACQGAFGAPRT